MNPCSEQSVLIIYTLYRLECRVIMVHPLEEGNQGLRLLLGLTKSLVKARLHPLGPHVQRRQQQQLRGHNPQHLHLGNTMEPQGQAALALFLLLHLQQPHGSKLAHLELLTLGALLQIPQHPHRATLDQLTRILMLDTTRPMEHPHHLLQLHLLLGYVQ